MSMFPSLCGPLGVWFGFRIHSPLSVLHVWAIGPSHQLHDTVTVRSIQCRPERPGLVSLSAYRVSEFSHSGMMDGDADGGNARSKTAMVLALCRMFRNQYSIAAVCPPQKTSTRNARNRTLAREYCYAWHLHRDVMMLPSLLMLI